MRCPVCERHMAEDRELALVRCINPECAAQLGLKPNEMDDVDHLYGIWKPCKKQRTIKEIEGELDEMKLAMRKPFPIFAGEWTWAARHRWMHGPIDRPALGD